jgi:hypothetical protein
LCFAVCCYPIVFAIVSDPSIKKLKSPGTRR